MRDIVRRLAAILLVAATLLVQQGLSPSIASADTPRSDEGEAYAIVTDDGGLVFLRSHEPCEDSDSQVNPEPQTVVDICGNAWQATKVYAGIEEATYDTPASSPWNRSSDDITSFRVADGCLVRPVSCAYLLSCLSSMETCDLAGLDTSHATSMRGMLQSATSLRSIDLSVLDGSSVTDMSCLLCDCGSLESANLTGLDTSHVTDTGCMFEGCASLRTLDLATLDTHGVRDMSRMFCGCTSLTRLDIGSVDTSSAIIMEDMFGNCRELREVTLGSAFSFDGAGIEDASLKAVLCHATGDPRANAWHMRGDESTTLTGEQLRDGYDGSAMAGTWVRATQDVDDAHDSGEEGNPMAMTPTRSALDHAITRTSPDELAGEAYAVYDAATRTLTLVRSTDEVTSGAVQTVTDTCGNEWTGTFWGGVEETSTSAAGAIPWHGVTATMEAFRIADGCAIHPTSCAWWLCGAERLTTVDLAGLDTSRATSLSHMFEGCEALRRLDLAMLDTSSVETADEMFARCTSLCEVTLGRDFSFLPGATEDNALPDPPYDEDHTGNWSLREDPTQSLGSFALEYLYDGDSMAGTWFWETPTYLPIAFDLNGGSAPDGATYPTTYRMGLGVELPGTEGAELPAPIRDGYAFLCWTDEEGRIIQMVDALSTGPRTVTAQWDAPQIRVSVPVAQTFEACRQDDGSLSLVPIDGDFTLAVTNHGPSPVLALASAEAADGFAIADPGGMPGDREAEVWLTPVTTGSDPTAEGYDPAADDGYQEHAQVMLSELGDGRRVGQAIAPSDSLWLNGMGGAMGDLSGSDGTKTQIGTIHWTFAVASEG